jgi:hypothetical protein
MRTGASADIHPREHEIYLFVSVGTRLDMSPLGSQSSCETLEAQVPNCLSEWAENSDCMQPFLKRATSRLCRKALHIHLLEMVQLKLFRCFCCGSQPNSHPSTPRIPEEHKDTTISSEGPEVSSIGKLRSEVRTMMSQQQRQVLDYEDIVTGVDYLPLYHDRAGQLSFNGVTVKVTFTEPRLRSSSAL